MPFGENIIGTLYATIDGKRIELGEATLTEVETYLEESKYEWGIVVRCKDCKHWINHDRRCGFWNHGVKRDDYCSYAERREGGKSVDDN